MEHFVYVLSCADGTLYTGYTTDVTRRVNEHNGLTKKPGARYTRSRRPVALSFVRSFTTRSEALTFEAHMKSLSRAQKLALINA